MPNPVIKYIKYSYEKYPDKHAIVHNNSRVYLEKSLGKENRCI